MAENCEQLRQWGGSATFSLNSVVWINATCSLNSCMAICFRQHNSSSSNLTASSYSVGYVLSQGGFDWWGFNFWIHFSEDNMRLYRYFSGPTDVDGVPLSLPPIHVHHHELFGLTGHLYIEHNGDYGCDEVADLCFTRDFNGHAMILQSWMRIQALLNDVRPKHSSLLKWRFNVTFWMLPPAQVDETPVSFKLFSASETIGSSTVATTFLVLDSHTDWFLYFAGKMQIAGTLLHRSTFTHTHSQSFQRSIFYAAAPRDLGLHGRLALRKACKPLQTSTLGFSNNDALYSYILSPHQSFLVCDSNGSQANVSGRWYDRAEHVRCRPFSFSVTDDFTVVSFWGVPPSGHAAEQRVVKEHIFWYVFFLSDTTPFYGSQFYGSDISSQLGNVMREVPWHTCQPETPSVISHFRLSFYTAWHDLIAGRVCAACSPDVTAVGNDSVQYSGTRLLVGAGLAAGILCLFVWITLKLVAGAEGSAASNVAVFAVCVTFTCLLLIVNVVTIWYTAIIVPRVAPFDSLLHDVSLTSYILSILSINIVLLTGLAWWVPKRAPAALL